MLAARAVLQKVYSSHRRSILRLVALLLYLVAVLTFILGIVAGMFFATTPAVVVDRVGNEYMVSRGAPMYTQGLIALVAGVDGGLLLGALAHHLSAQAEAAHHQLLTVVDQEPRAHQE
jgi:MFS family permease